MKIEVLSSRWVNKEHTNFVAKIKVDGSDEMGYYVATEVNDSAEIHKYLLKQYRSRKIIPNEFYEDPKLIEEDVKSKRKALLEETDYLMMSDYPISDSNRAKLSEYRQALRDITKQSGYPNSVVWPKLPSFVK